eukprot:CAMPEP_0196705276 /NCGR_PEP_ID=MMETSP1090-20130531/59586_1 /TAXON_ID=37098 /ORGANISM="Isochrysis sp, Strain CCMP1244" /LENGTH=109 /DNA_ID=CAMNT_0042045177 /DNA_START=252 /DNA_END=578 /DNA_ORIENTATION=-
MALALRGARTGIDNFSLQPERDEVLRIGLRVLVRDVDLWARRVVYRRVVRQVAAARARRRLAHVLLAAAVLAIEHAARVDAPHAGCVGRRVPERVARVQRKVRAVAQPR